MFSGAARSSYLGAITGRRSSERRFGFDPENGKRAGGAARGEIRGGYWEGESSESLNPMDGFGMRQGRGGAGGMRRQEVEKA